MTTRSTLKALRRRYVDEGQPLPRDVEAALRRDTRAGARSLLEAVDRRRRTNRAEGQRLRRMLRHERALWAEGVTRVAGVDEAGMAPLAGPVAAAAVILPPEWRREGVDDSKRLTPSAREALAAIIKREAVAWAVGEASVDEIDTLNIHHAGLLAMRRAVEALEPAAEALLVDARTVPETPLRQQGLVRGDQRSLCIAAASILAKTTRDAFMVAQDARYPGYGFAQHKGYPVPAHREAVVRLGPSPIHRRTFVGRLLG